MNLTLESQTLILFFTLFIIRHVFRIMGNKKRKCNKSSMNIPEPSGRLPLIGHLHLLRGQDPVFKKLSAMADKLGPFFSLKLGFYRLIVVSDPETVKDCFTTNDRVLATRPNLAAGKYIGYENAALALAPYGNYWREIRKISTVHLFSNRSLETLDHIRVSEVNAFLKQLFSITLEDGKRQVEINKLFEFLTLNIILRTVLGKRVEFGEDESEEWRYKGAIKQAEHLFGLFMLCDAIPWLKWLDFIKVRSMKRTAKDLDMVITKWLQEHLDKKSRNCSNAQNDLKSFMGLLLEILPEDVVLSGHTRNTIVKATALILTLTGSDSTSVTLTWALSLLLNNRDALKTAQEELDMVIGKERWVEESDIGQLKYLQAVVKETFRLYPPAPLTGLREATKDCYINGHRVAQGTRLVVNIWKLHRDPRVWEEPEKFKPERFLTGKSWSEGIGYPTNFEYIPFSAGRRSCPGFHFGLKVVHLALARLLQGFEIETTGKPVDMTEGSSLALFKVKPVEVAVVPRLKPDIYECL